MSRGRLAIHGHFYQPERRNPFTGAIPRDRTAAPFENWNARINAECYRPNAERGNLDRSSFDIGPTLTAWLAEEEPRTLARMVAADHGANGLAQGFHHAILPLASARDRLTEIRWGLADFAHRFGRRAAGLWLPETAVDLPTLRALADEGVTWTLLAPWQVSDPSLDVRRPYRVDLGRGRSIAAMVYHGPLSGAISFQPELSADADRFASEQVRPALDAPLAEQPGDAVAPAVRATAAAARGRGRGPRSRPDEADARALVAAGTAHDAGATRGANPASAARAADAGERPATADTDRQAGDRRAASPLLVIATDGELYGHHQRWRDLFLARLLDPDEDRGFDVVSLGAVMATLDPATLPAVRISERTSWSCHHGVLRWSAECPCAHDGRWKAPLRVAFERLAGGIDAITELIAARLPAPSLAGGGAAFDPWAARDAYAQVLLGATSPADFARARLAPGAGAAARSRLLTLMEAQRWRLAMFASCGWFWEDPGRPETRQVLLAAARAARLVDGLAGTTLERSLVADLGLLASPSRGIDGASLYRQALVAAGQPA